MAELQRLQDERLQRRLQREKLRGPSKKRGNKDKDGKNKKKSKAGDGIDEEEAPDLEVDVEVEFEDEGLLGTYELQACRMCSLWTECVLYACWGLMNFRHVLALDYHFAVTSCRL